ncbi:MAG: ATP-binding protein [Clostridia bacterium]|nr:ATP-binding protein [Clostridia bacterium]
MRDTTKELIKQYMLGLISVNDAAVVAKTVENFGKSKSTVYNYLKELLDEGTVYKHENKNEYYLAFTQKDFSYANNGKLDEARVFASDIEPMLSDLPKNVFRIWQYAFCEMMNNAIEHSKSDIIEVRVTRDAVKTEVHIFDNGIGIFKNIRNFILSERGEDTPLAECASILLAGKFTTNKSAHSGEGIFFTSHLMDSFMIFSDRAVFVRDNFKDDWENYGGREAEESNGTLVIMSLNNYSKKTSREVFDRFSTVDEGFIKTSIPVAHFFQNGYPVSRSEARRLGELLLSFEEADLDFAGVEELGQAFVHELFVVWQGKNPNIKLNVLNAMGDAQWMIRRVLNTK